MEDLLEELEFEEEDLQEYEMYYLEGWEVGEENKVEV